MLIKSRIAGFINKVYQTKGGIWCRDLFVPKHQNILYILKNVKTGQRRMFAGHNIVTDDGDVWYAENLDSSPSPTNTFNFLYLSSVAFSLPGDPKTTDAGDLANTTVANGSSKKQITSTWPKQNGTDGGANTGGGTTAVSHKFEYTTGDFDDPSIEGVTIATTSTTFGSGTDPLLNARNETAFEKTSSDTLDVYINHTLLGV